VSETEAPKLIHFFLHAPSLDDLMPQTSSDPNTGAPAVARQGAPTGVGIGKGKGKAAAPRIASKILGRSAKGMHLARKMPAKKAVRPAASARPKKRARPGEAAIKKCKKYQQSSELFIRKAPFQRCLREVLMSINTEDKVSPRVESDAYQFMHEACEAYLIELLQDSQTSACFRNHVTLTAWDMTFTRRMRHEIED